jgi:hypothetical protein
MAELDPIKQRVVVVVDDAIRKTTKFDKKMSDTERKSVKSTARIGQGFRSLVGPIKVATAAVAGFGAGMTVMVTKQLKAIDVIDKTSERLNIATNDLVAFTFAVEQNGASSEALNMGLQRMTRRISEAASGTGEAVKALDELDLDARELAAMSAGDQFRTLADAISGVASQGRRAALTQKLFDSEGVKLLNTLQLGSAALRQYADDAERMGLAVSQVDADNIALATATMSRLGKQIEGVIRQFTIELAPAITAFGAAMQDAGGSADKAGSGIKVMAAAVTEGLRQGAAFGAFVVQTFQSVELAVALGRTELLKWRDSLAHAGQAVAGFGSNLGEVFAGIGDIIGAAFDSPVAAIKVLFGKMTASVIGLVQDMASNIHEALIGLVPDSVSNQFNVLNVKLGVAKGTMEGLARTADEQMGGAMTAALDRTAAAATNLFNVQTTGSQAAQEQMAAMTPRFLELGASFVSPLQAAQNALHTFDETFRQVGESVQEATGGEGGGLNILGMLGLDNPDKMAEAMQMGLDRTAEYMNNLVGITSEGQRQITETERRYAEQRAAFEAMTAKEKTKHVLGELQNMTQGLARHNKVAFDINKGLGIANATIGAYESFNKNLAAYPQPLGGILAAGALASGLMQVQAIASQQFSRGGGGGGGRAAPAPAPANVAAPSTGAAPGPQQISIDASSLNTIPGDNLMRVGDAQSMLDGVNTALMQRGQAPLTGAGL